MQSLYEIISKEAYAITTATIVPIIFWITTIVTSRIQTQFYIKGTSRILDELINYLQRVLSCDAICVNLILLSLVIDVACMATLKSAIINFEIEISPFYWVFLVHGFVFFIVIFLERKFVWDRGCNVAITIHNHFKVPLPPILRHLPLQGRSFIIHSKHCFALALGIGSLGTSFWIAFMELR